MKLNPPIFFRNQVVQNDAINAFMQGFPLQNLADFFQLHLLKENTAFRINNWYRHAGQIKHQTSFSFTRIERTYKVFFNGIHINVKGKDNIIE